MYYIRIYIFSKLPITERTFRGRGSRSTGCSNQSEDVERFDRKSQAEMVEGVQEPKDQFAHDTTDTVWQVSYLFPFH